jgi:uncharacterized protein (TIGR02301 family)
MSALALAFSAGVAAAQPSPKPPAAAPTTAPAPPPAAAPAQEPPPYEPDLLRLAEIMGALAYLRDLCGDDDGAEWRNRVAALIAAESNDATRKAVLAGAFNRGFRGYGLTYHSCTPAAHVVIGRFLEEGGRLARDITSRYGGG